MSTSPQAQRKLRKAARLNEEDPGYAKDEDGDPSADERQEQRRGRGRGKSRGGKGRGRGRGKKAQKNDEGDPGEVAEGRVKAPVFKEEMGKREAEVAVEPSAASLLAPKSKARKAKQPAAQEVQTGQSLLAPKSKARKAKRPAGQEVQTGQSLLAPKSKARKVQDAELAKEAEPAKEELQDAEPGCDEASVPAPKSKARKVEEPVKAPKARPAKEPQQAFRPEDLQALESIADMDDYMEVPQTVTAGIRKPRPYRTCAALHAWCCLVRVRLFTCCLTAILRARAACACASCALCETVSLFVFAATAYKVMDRVHFQIKCDHRGCV